MRSFHGGFLEQVIIILFHPVQACSYMDTMSILCSLQNLVFSVRACMYALSAISKLDLRVWLEIRYWAFFFHTLLFLFPFSCLSSLPYAMFAFSARTWLKDLLSHLLHKHIFCFSVCCWCSLSNHVPPHCTSPSLFLPVLLPVLLS